MDEGTTLEHTWVTNKVDLDLVLHYRIKFCLIPLQLGL